MDHEKFKNIAGGLQSIAVSLALIVGGAWSAWVLGGVERSRSEREKLRRELDGVVALDMSIAAEVLRPSEGETRDLIVEVTIKNPGTRYVYLDFDDPSVPVLQAQKVIFDPEGTLTPDGPSVASPLYGPTIRAYRGINLVAGATRQLPFYLQVPSSGMYMVTFSSPIARELEDKLESTPVGIPNAEVAKARAVWTSNKFIKVP